MTRARTNIELLIPRLKKLGYQFTFPDRSFVPADDETRRLVTDAERRVGPLPLSLRVWCEVVGEVNLMGSHPKLSTYIQFPSGAEIGQSFMSLFAKHGEPAPTTGNPLRDSAELTSRLLDEVVQGIKSGQLRMPPIAAGVLASKDFLSQFQRQVPVEGPDVDSDPLVVEPYFMDLEDDMDENEDPDEAEAAGAGSHNVIIAPDSVHKTNHSGGSPYTISFPNPAVDATLDGDEDYGTFIEYLRICFRWGGFPGLRASAKPPREELDFLTQALSPL
jgi:hypothetical protein